MSIVVTILSLFLFVFVPFFTAPELSFAEPALPKARSLGSEIPALQPDDLGKTLTSPELRSPTGTLSLQQTLTLALMHNPKLAAVSWALRARDAATLQAGLWPNPRFSLEIENFIGTGDLRGANAAETTLSLKQRFETAGKRQKRKNVAVLEHRLAGWDYETLRLDLFTEVSKVFIEVLGDQEKVVLAKDLLDLASRVANVVEKRVDAGKVSPVEAIKTNVALSSARIDLNRAQRELVASRLMLSVTWGNPDATFKDVLGQLAPAASIPSFETLVMRLPQNPELARWKTELDQRKAVLALEKAAAFPDITFGGGFRQFNETNDSALVGGVSIDLPFFNRNQGNIQRARAENFKAEAKKQVTVLRLSADLAQAHRFLVTAHSEADGLKNDLLPGAKKAFEAVSEGYRLGKFNLLDVFDAQRTLAEARAQYLQTQIDYQKALADVERLIGEKLK